MGKIGSTGLRRTALTGIQAVLVVFFQKKITSQMCKNRMLAGLCALLIACSAQAQSRYYDISKNLEIFANAYRELNQSYVDDLDPNKLLRMSMDAMLGGLDPFTNYISETDIESYRLASEGRYNGLGAQGRLMGDYVVLTDMFKDSPAQKAGLKVGDAIIAVEGRSTKGRSEEQVLEFMRGAAGTDLTLTVRRPGESKDLTITVKREEIEAPNVPYSGIVAEGIAYVNLSTFTANAGPNVLKALRDLEKDHKLSGVILDLRHNGGGLLSEAVNLVGGFVPRGEFVVSMKGKSPENDQEFRSLTAPWNTDIRLAVLIDAKSASASEIVSGALQDLDRAVIIGQRSYGKGLVQNVKEVGYNAKIKLTTAKYYIPSGRCIQSARYKNGEPVNIPDSERAVFRTRNKRPVLDGGGVTPDIILPADTASNYVKALLEQHVIFDYVTQFCAKTPQIDSAAVFKFQDWEGFKNYVTQTRKFAYESPAEKALAQMRLLAGADDYAADAEIMALEQKIKAAKQNELERNKARIVREIEQEIVGRYHYARGKVQKRLNNDPEVEEAIRVLNNPERYHSILKGAPK